MPYYQRLGEVPRKHHIWFIATDRRRATRTKASPMSTFSRRKDSMRRTRSCITCGRLLGSQRRVNQTLGTKKSTDSPLRHHHLKTANIPRRGDLYTGRIPMLFNQDVIAYRASLRRRTTSFNIIKTAAPMRSFLCFTAAA
jgi:homogentisate 1,2-dioxygenase